MEAHRWLRLRRAVKLVRTHPASQRPATAPPQKQLLFLLSLLRVCAGGPLAEVGDSAAAISGHALVLRPGRPARYPRSAMPSFDIGSEIDKQEIDNAINQSIKELATRFDFKGSTASIEWNEKESKIELKAEDASRLKSLHDIVTGKLAKRGIDLRNVERKDPAISPLGHATQDFVIKQGLDGDKAKEIVKAIKEQAFKVQSALQERQIRVTGKKRDELQEVIAFLRARDFAVSLGFKNFRD